MMVWFLRCIAASALVGLVVGVTVTGSIVGVKNAIAYANAEVPMKQDPLVALLAERCAPAERVASLMDGQQIYVIPCQGVEYTVARKVIR